MEKADVAIRYLVSPISDCHVSSSPPIAGLAASPCRPQRGQHSGAKTANRLSVTVRRIVGRLGCGGRPSVDSFSSPMRAFEPQLSLRSVCDAGHRRVAAQTSPGAALEVA